MEKEKSQIIEAIINQQEILSSKDAKKVRDYFEKINAGNNKGLESLKTTSDEALLQQADNMACPVSFKKEQLESPQAQWEIKEASAVVQFVDTDGMPITLSAHKIGSVWY